MECNAKCHWHVTINPPTMDFSRQYHKIYQEHIEDLMKCFAIYHQWTREKLFDYKVISSIQSLTTHVQNHHRWFSHILKSRYLWLPWSHWHLSACQCNWSLYTDLAGHFHNTYCINQRSSNIWNSPISAMS